MKDVVMLYTVCEKTLKKYMHGIGVKVNLTIRNIRAGKIYGISIDGIMALQLLHCDFGSFSGPIR